MYLCSSISTEQVTKTAVFILPTIYYSLKVPEIVGTNAIRNVENDVNDQQEKYQLCGRMPLSLYNYLKYELSNEQTT